MFPLKKHKIIKALRQDRRTLFGASFYISFCLNFNFFRSHNVRATKTNLSSGNDVISAHVSSGLTHKGFSLTQHMVFILVMTMTGLWTSAMLHLTSFLFTSNHLIASYPNVANIHLFFFFRSYFIFF